MSTQTNRTRRWQGATNVSAAQSTPCSCYEAVQSDFHTPPIPIPGNYESTVPSARQSETPPLTEPKKWLLAVMMILGAIFVDYWTRTLPWNDCLDPYVMDRVQKEWDHEEVKRQRLNMVWVNVEAHSCTSYATRKYTARLANVPSDYNHRVEACKATPLDVHGQSYLPHTCEDNVNGTIGTWNVDQSQPDCVTFWTDYKDKGCTSVGSGKRLIEHHLQNLPPGGDYGKFCATTPVRFHGMQFPGAQKALQSVWGVYGLWEIDDDTC
ncbi:hypothetical protein BDN67DRAFT_974311 [Paxillus ammoniavirescens]|nr:hypothetical protein BDN67DRAFT_974311 [Paxillus ammoniavirescens]